MNKVSALHLPASENAVKETLKKHLLADGFDFVMDFEKSHGSWIHDQRSGEEYLDLFSMYGSASVGYNHPYILEKTEWLGKRAVYKPTLSDVYLEEYAEFMKTFSRMVIPKELPYCFFIEGGAMAVENALKTAFDWKTRKNWQNGSETEGSMVIHFKQAFHGRSGYTLSLTNTTDPRKYQYFPLFDWPRITNPKLHFSPTEENLQETIKLEKLALLEIEHALLEHQESIACIIIEVIQAEGGDNHFRKEFLVELRRICDEHEILLIFDEVQTGIGITGKMWAYEHFGVVPDVLTFGKKTQVCGILANKKKLDQVEKHVFSENSRINSTFGGNFIDMLRFQLILEIIEQENLLDNAAKMGDYLLEGLLKLHEKFPHLISNARGKGLMCAFDLPDAAVRSGIMDRLYAERIIILSCGERSLRFRPHLNVTEADLEYALIKLEHIAAEY